MIRISIDLRYAVKSLYNSYIFVTVLPPGKIAWSAVRSTWSGRRNLINASSNSSMIVDLVDAKNVLQSQVSVQSALPTWCSFVGMEYSSYVLIILYADSTVHSLYYI